MTSNEILNILSDALEAIELLRKCQAGRLPVVERKKLRDQAYNKLDRFLIESKAGRDFGPRSNMADTILKEITGLI